jgi:hypothetical protein
MIGKEIDVSGFFTEGTRTPKRDQLEAANEYVFSKVLELREMLEERKSSKRGHRE